jgi:P-type Ca2+ transporter type 2C
VYRDGVEFRVDSEELVPGDVIKLSAGDRVPADARIIEQNAAKVDESVLTGESVPVGKTTQIGSKEHGVSHRNMLFAGSTLISGTALAVVTATGSDAGFGRIASLTNEIADLNSPLEIEMKRMSKRITCLALAIGIAMFAGAALLANVSLPHAFIFALGMVVAFVPEGMVPTITLSLALAVEKMARNNALVRKLSAVETLGCTTVICTDKTGTLTENRMTVRSLWLPPGSNLPAMQDELLRCACLCNDAELMRSNDTTYSVVGDSMEGALLAFAADSGLDYRDLRNLHTRTFELPFDSDRKRMTTGHDRVAYVKGAALELVRRCSMSAAERDVVHRAVDEFAAAGLRVLGFAVRTFDSPPVDISIGAIEHNLSFIGLVAFYDPPRAEIKTAVRMCHAAGIRIIMLTGDYPLTAEAIARHVDIAKPTDHQVVTGEQMDELSDEQLLRLLDQPVIFARVSPHHKLRVVKALQRSGNVVAVTGDGVNDAPALKQADIGIAMGKRGTDVARAAADIVLLDDNFATIVKAIEQGRTVYGNIRKFATYVFNSNMAEAVPFAVMLFSRGAVPLPLNIMQVLSIDLGTDIMPAIALGIDNNEDDIMKQKPRRLDVPLLEGSLLAKALLWYGLIESVAGLSCYFFANYLNGWPNVPLAAAGTLAYARATTMTLSGIVFSQIGAVLCCRSNRQSVIRCGIFSNRAIWFGVAAEILLLAILCYSPAAHQVFGTAPLSMSELGFASIWAPVIVLADEARKAWLRRGDAVPLDNDKKVVA